MHVCMLTDYFLPHMFGGTERTVYEIGRRLVRRGHQVTVLTLDVHGYERHSQIKDMNIYRMPAVSLTKLIGAQLAISPFSLLTATRIVRSIRPNIIHAHNLYFNLTAIAPIIKHLSRTPLVTTLHLPKMKYGKPLLDLSIQIYQKTIGHLIVKSSDELIAVSRSVRTHAIEDLMVHPYKIALIPNGVDTNVFLPNNQSHQNTIITYIGRLIQNKGPQYLVQATPYILKYHPEARIYIVGEGPLKDELMRQVISQNLEDNVHFLGNVSDVLPVLQSTTIFVRPSLTEGMSLAVLEAMACGLPVVASNLEGNAEIIDNGETGYLVPPADSRALAEAISLLLDNHKIASQIGNNARKKTEEFYDWERVTDQTLKIYLALVEDVK